jgi:hypothetical protein
VALTDQHRRQIAQFMLIVEVYLDLASPAIMETSETLGMTRHRFIPGESITSEDRTLAIIGAHVSSAAIRLASIQDVLDDAGVPNRSYRECRAYFSGKSTLDDVDPRACHVFRMVSRHAPRQRRP